MGRSNSRGTVDKISQIPQCWSPILVITHSFLPDSSSALCQGDPGVVPREPCVVILQPSHPTSDNHITPLVHFDKPFAATSVCMAGFPSVVSLLR